MACVTGSGLSWPPRRTAHRWAPAAIAPLRTPAASSSNASSGPWGASRASRTGAIIRQAIRPFSACSTRSMRPPWPSSSASEQPPPRWPALAIALGDDPSPAPDLGPALKPLLKKLPPPPGAFITADAMDCHQASSRFNTRSSAAITCLYLRATKAASSIKPSACSPSGVWPVGEDTWPLGPSAHRAGGPQP